MCNSSAKSLWTYFDILKKETYFCSAYIKFGLVDLIGEKIYHGRRNRLAVGEGEYMLD